MELKINMHLRLTLNSDSIMALLMLQDIIQTIVN